MITLLKKAALLGVFALLAVMMWAGPASAAENGSIYYLTNGYIYSVDPAANNGGGNPVTNFNGVWDFDISRDGQTLVYNQCGMIAGCGAALYTVPLSDAEYHGSTVWITNLSSSATEIESPQFSPDGETIYFAGKHVLESDTDTYGIYSVPTNGGEATKIPIDSDDTANLSTFDLSRDGSKFAIGAMGGIFTVPVSGGAPTRITNDSCKWAGHPDFSSDDQTIIYTSPVYDNDTCEGNSVANTLFTTPVSNDGTQPGKAVFPDDLLPPYPTYAAHRSKWYGTYSPDGESITFSNWRDDSYNLATALATGGNVTNITEWMGENPVWAEKPPETTIETKPPTVTKDATSSFSFSSNDEAATFECRLDHYWWDEGDGFESCTSPKQYEYDDLLDPEYPPEWQTAEGSHTFEVRAVRSGGAADPTPASYTWTVDTTAPTVGNVSPADAASDVALTANVEASFSDWIDSQTLTSDTFTLTKQGSTIQVAAKVTYDSTSHKATLDPTSDLEANTTYTATVKSGSDGVKDQAGNALEQDYSWTFTTIDPPAPPPDTTKPTVDSLLATDLGGNVPLRKTSFKATFSEKMKTTTLSTSTFKLFKCSSTTSTNCTTQIAAADAPVTPSSDGLSATLDPYGPTSTTLLAKNTKYKVVIITGAQDLAGNALAQEKVAYFTTGSK